MNYYEVKFLKEYFGLLKRDTANIVVYPIQVTIEEDPLGDTEMGVSDGREAQPHGGDDPLCLRSDERTETGGFQLNVGFVVLTTEEIPKVLYFRIQNHLRKTGLGRKAVQALLARCPTAELASEQVGSSMETPSSAELRRFYQFFNSLKRSGPQG
jgi:hypothetical protein